MPDNSIEFLKDYWKRDGSMPGKIVRIDLGDDFRSWMRFAAGEPEAACEFLVERTEWLRGLGHERQIALYVLVRKVDTVAAKTLRKLLLSGIADFFAAHDPEAPGHCEQLVLRFMKDGTFEPGFLEKLSAYGRIVHRRMQKKAWLSAIATAVLMTVGAGALFKCCGGSVGNVSLWIALTGAVLAFLTWRTACLNAFRLVYAPPIWLSMLLSIGCFSLAGLHLVTAKLWIPVLLIQLAVWAVVLLAARKRQGFFTGAVRGVVAALFLVLALWPLYYFSHWPAPRLIKFGNSGANDREMSRTCKQRKFETLRRKYVAMWRSSMDYRKWQNALGDAAALAVRKSREAAAAPRSERSGDVGKKTSAFWKEFDRREKAFSELDPAPDAPWRRDLKTLFGKLLDENGAAADYFAAFSIHDGLCGKYGSLFGPPDKAVEVRCYENWVDKAVAAIRTAPENVDVSESFIRYTKIAAKAEASGMLSGELLREKKKPVEDRIRRIEAEIGNRVVEATSKGGGAWEDLPPEYIEAYIGVDERLMWAMYERGHKASGVEARDERYLNELESRQPRTAERLVKCAESRLARNDKAKALDDLDAAGRLGDLRAMHKFVELAGDDDPRVREQLKRLFAAGKAASAEILRLAHLSFRDRDWHLAEKCYEAVDPAKLAVSDRRTRSVIFRELKNEGREFDELAAAFLQELSSRVVAGGVKTMTAGDLDRCFDLGRKLKRETQLHALLEKLVLADRDEAAEKYVELSSELKRVNIMAWLKLREHFARDPRFRYRYAMLGRLVSPSAFYGECEKVVEQKCANWALCAETAALYAFDKRQYSMAVKFFRLLPASAAERHIEKYAAARWHLSDRSVEAVELYVKAIEAGSDYDWAMRLGGMFESSDPALAVYVLDRALQFTDDPKRAGMAADRICKIVMTTNPRRVRAKRYSFDDRVRQCLAGYRSPQSRNGPLSEKMSKCLRLAYAVNGPDALIIIANAYCFQRHGDLAGRDIRAIFARDELLTKMEEAIGSDKTPGNTRRRLVKFRKILLNKR